jgi:HSP20 family protein
MPQDGDMPQEDPMDWKKIAPRNWFKDESSLAARAEASADPFDALRTEMERVFDDTFRRFYAGRPRGASAPGRIPAALRPSVDISEGKKAYTVRADVPGMDREDLSIEVEGHTLAIRGEKRRESEEEEEGYHCLERSYGAVQRVLSLPDDADAEAIEAKFKNGVLTLKIPKHAPEASQARRVEVTVG